MFICFFDEDFCRKSISETCITSLYNYLHFWHKKGSKGAIKTIWTFSIFIQIKCILFCKVFLFMSYWRTILFFNSLISKRGLIRVSNSTFRIIKRFIVFFFFYQFWREFVVEWIVLRAIGSMSTDFLYFSYSFRDKLDRKRPKSANIRHFKGFTFHPIWM